MQPLYPIIKMGPLGMAGATGISGRRDKEGFVPRLTSNLDTPSLSRTKMEGAQGNKRQAALDALDTSSSSM